MARNLDFIKIAFQIAVACLGGYLTNKYISNNMGGNLGGFVGCAILFASIYKFGIFEYFLSLDTSSDPRNALVGKKKYIQYTSMKN